MGRLIKLLHDAKRCYVYSYGLDGKITIQKRLLENDDIDFVEAIENADIEIENSSDAKDMIGIGDKQVDTDALLLISEILESLNK